MLQQTCVHPDLQPSQSLNAIKVGVGATIIAQAIVSCTSKVLENVVCCMMVGLSRVSTELCKVSDSIADTVSGEETIMA